MEPYAAQSSPVNPVEEQSRRGGALFRLPAPVYPQLSPHPEFNALLDLKLSRMDQALKELEAQTHAGEETEKELSSIVAKLLTAYKVPRALPSPLTIKEDYDFALQLVDFPITPLYIKRPFDLSFKVMRKNLDSESTIFPLCCLLSVRKMDDNNTEITKARSGKPFLRGQLTRVFAQSNVMTFHDLVFTDISSLFSPGRVNIWVHCVSQQRFKPLMIEGVRVKARKKHPDEVI